MSTDKHIGLLFHINCFTYLQLGAGPHMRTARRLRCACALGLTAPTSGWGLRTLGRVSACCACAWENVRMHLLTVDNGILLGVT